MAPKKQKEKKVEQEVKLPILSSEGKRLRELTVDAKLVALKLHKQVVHDAAVMYLANRRSGTASTKGRSDVNKSTKKPWRQKGTGNARAGRASSPLWVGGGVVFGPKPRDYSYQLPKKMKKLALFSSMAQKIRDGEVVLVEQLKLEEPKTKLASKMLERLEVLGSALLVTHNVDKTLNRATRNIPKVTTTTLSNLNTLDVLKHKKVVMPQEVFEQFSAQAAGEQK